MEGQMFRADDGVEVVFLHDGEMFSLDEGAFWVPAVTFRPAKTEDSHRTLTMPKKLFDARYAAVAEPAEAN